MGEPREQPEPTEEMRERARLFALSHIDDTPECSEVHDECLITLEASRGCSLVDSLSLLLAQVAEEGRKAGMREAAGIARSVDLSAQFRLDISPRILVAEAIEREASR